MTVPFSFVDLCAAELELCALREGESVAVLSQMDERQDYADAFMAAARRLGAVPFHVRLPEASTNLAGDAGAWTVGVTPLASNRPAIDALKQADLVIDLMFLLFSREQIEIQEAGTRMLLCIEPVDMLARLFPTVDQRAPGRGQRGAARRRPRRSASRTRAGTDVTYKLGDYPVMTEYGYTDMPGPLGPLAVRLPVHGRRGRRRRRQGRRRPRRHHHHAVQEVTCSDPIEITIEAGRIADIRGGFEAELLRDYMADFDDPDAYGISHIGWGSTSRRAGRRSPPTAAALGMEPRAFYGNVLFSTGPNQELGGAERHALPPRHPDAQLQRSSSTTSR